MFSRYTRDALAKATYSLLFQLLIDKLNSTLQKQGPVPKDAKTIGILVRAQLRPNHAGLTT